MARFASILALSAALGATAHPSRHAHLHNQKRAVEQRADGDLIVATIDGVVVSWTQSGDYYGAAAATPSVPPSTPALATPTPTAPALDINVNVAAAASSSAAASTAAASSSDDDDDSDATLTNPATVIDSYTSFDDLCASSSKRATLAQIAATGNTGSVYGCNMALTTDADVAAQYDNYVEFTGVTEDNICYFWNKAGADGLTDGFILSDNYYKTFALSPGESKYLVIDSGSYGAASCQPASVAPVVNPQNGAIAYTWVEWTMVDDVTGWSAADASSIQADYALQLGVGVVNGLEVTSPDLDTVSSITSGGTAYVNSYSIAEEADDGYAIQCEGTLKVKANFGF